MTGGQRRAPWARAAATGAVALLTGLAGCGMFATGQPAEPSSAADDGPPVVVHDRANDSDFAGLEVAPPLPLPRARLTSDDGSRFALPADLDRPVTVFFFGYTNCPDVCTLVMSDLTLAVARLPERLRDQVRVVFVTSDPARDDPATLRRYLGRFDPDFTGLTGELDIIVDLAGAMGIAIEKGPKLPSGGYEVGHGAQLIGYVGDDGVLVWSQGVSVDDLTDDLARLATDAAPAG
ncbi:SCO family protein [soil metagenome]